MHNIERHETKQHKIEYIVLTRIIDVQVTLQLRYKHSLKVVFNRTYILLRMGFHILVKV